MRERGVQSRRRAATEAEPGHKSAPASSRGNPWQVIAIVALIVATAGWTTVAVLALRPASVAESTPTQPVDAGIASDAPSDAPADSPVAETHDAPDLEAVLPADLGGTAMTTESWTGDAILSDDGWSTSMLAFLTAAGKTATDLQVAQAYDATQTLDGSVGVYRVAGIEGTALQDALIAAWKTDYPDMVASQVTLGGVPVTKASFGPDSVNSYLYKQGNDVFDIETTDEAIAAAAIASLTGSGTTPSAGPASPPPSTSPAPSPS